MRRNNNMGKDKMNFGVAMINIKNAMRALVGLPKQFPVKVVRSAEAKQFKMMDISKAGDVGYNLASIKEVIIPAPSPEQRKAYHYHKERAGRYKYIGNEEIAAMHDEKALAALPKAVIPTGVKIEMPNNLWCSVESRSSSSSKMLIAPDSIIDAGYRGEMFAVVYNFGYKDYRVATGEMLVQIIFHERIIAKMTEVDKLGESARGETGFGSTGSKAGRAK
jgi:dUTP pyrophosphatase